MIDEGGVTGRCLHVVGLDTGVEGSGVARQPTPHVDTVQGLAHTLPAQTGGQVKLTGGQRAAQGVETITQLCSRRSVFTLQDTSVVTDTAGQMW